ncbi:MAG: MFS transporter [Chloroflexi bacterium]|nr:MFS transporter [Chloroflexota bacterium]
MMAPTATERPSQAERLPGTAWKWWLIIVLFLATVLTYLDRQTLSLCASMISTEFSLSNEQYGQLVAAFRWAYAFMHVPAGWLADHLAIRPIYALAVGVWSLAGAAGAVVFSYRQMWFTRGLLGVGEAFNWPCATRMVANLLPPTDRGLGSGIFNSGAAAGSLLAPLIITPIAIHYGWRWAFFIIGALGAFWVALWLFATRRGTVAHAALRAVRKAVAPPAGQLGAARGLAEWARRVLLKPAFWMLLVVAVTVNPCWYFLNEWIPKYMHDQRGMGYLSAGLVTVPIFIGADLGNLLSGGGVKLLTLRGWSVRKSRGTVLGGAVALILPVALITQVSASSTAVVLLALAGLGITSIVANYTACMQDFSFSHVGIVAGINGLCSNVCSAVVNPWIGRYIDRTGNYELIFILMAVLPAVSLAAILIFDALISRGNAGAVGGALPGSPTPADSRARNNPEL